MGNVRTSLPRLNGGAASLVHPWQQHLDLVGALLALLDSTQSNDEKKGQLKDVDIWQMAPRSMAIGSFTGDRFTQFLGGDCKQGSEVSGRGNKLQKQYSYLSFDFRRQVLVAKTTFDFPSTVVLPPVLRPFDIELPMSDISSHGFHMYTESLGGGLTAVELTVCFRRPPRYFVKFEEDLPRTQGGRLHRRRATQLDFANSELRDAGEILPIPEGPCAYPTHWNAFRWILTLKEKDLRRLNACRQLIQAIDGLSLISPSPYQRTVEDNSDDWTVPDLSDLDFETRALVEGLVANGILRSIDWPALKDALHTFVATKAVRLRVLESLFTEERIRAPKTLVKKRARFLMQTPEVKDVDYLIMIRTVQITPTRMLIGPPQQEASNSVTRRYADSLDAIIRVQFADEGDRLHILDYAKRADEMLPKVGLMARVRRALTHGIVLAGETYYPIASSSSQQKDHAIWFYNPAVIKPAPLFKWIGTVKEQVVAKFAARMGLPFSTTRAVNIEVELGNLDDVEKNGHCFTDGSSVAGREVMWRAVEALHPNSKRKSAPSAIQFRLGGAKGMLSYWPQLARPNEVLLRKSQVKFPSNQRLLNVVRAAHYQTAFLNRQFIMIMEANGVPQQLFIDLFDTALCNLKGLDVRVKARRLTAEDEKWLSSFTQFPLSTMIKSGFHNNPFILDIVRLVKGRTLQDLKWRNRLMLNSGVYLMGISDEVSCLNEGEIFCQYQKDEDSETVIVTGEVLICRAPALHPGDVRRARAVDRPELRHLVNVIVFSTQGERPLPNMLGGGDLDGDDYTLIWDQRFVQPLREFEPMNYTAPPPIRVPKVTQEHVNENFVNYIINDILGQVDNAHLANSDKHTPFHAKCLKLSEIHSTAVDFAKTGQPAELDPDLVPTKWPDFMGKPEEKTYLSGKILGILFRKVDPAPTFLPSDLLIAEYAVEKKLMGLFGDGNYELFRLLRAVKARYENDLQYTMRRFKLQEAEVVTGVSGYNPNRKRSRELSHLHETMETIYEGHTETARECAFTVAKQIAVIPPGVTLGQYVAWHAYMLTFEPSLVKQWDADVSRGIWGSYIASEVAQSLRVLPMMSFGFVFWPELIELMTARGA